MVVRWQFGAGTRIATSVNRPCLSLNATLLEAGIMEPSFSLDTLTTTPCDSSDRIRANLFPGSTLSPVRADREGANIIKKALGLRVEMNENVGTVSGKMGELYISHAATIASGNFQNDLVETAK